MSTYTQKRKIKKFLDFTNTTDTALATTILKANKWDIQRAMDEFYRNGKKYAKKVDKSKISKIFNKYSALDDDDDEENLIGENGLATLLEEFGLGESWHQFAVSYFFKAAEMGAISEKEFTSTWENVYQVDSLSKMKSSITGVVEKLKNFKDPETRKYYRWIFDFYKEDERKTIDKEEAIEIWQTVLIDLPRGWKLETWIKWLEKQKVRVINRDLWNMLFDFFLEVDPDCSNFEDDGCWPSTLDEFVQMILEQ